MAIKIPISQIIMIETGSQFNLIFMVRPRMKTKQIFWLSFSVMFGMLIFSVPLYFIFYCLKLPLRIYYLIVIETFIVVVGTISATIYLFKKGYLDYYINRLGLNKEKK